MDDHHAERHGSARTSPIEGPDLIDRYLDRVYRFLSGMTGDEDMARDLTQETMLKLLQACPEPANADAYVFATARNVFRSRWRRRQLEDRHTVRVAPEELEPTRDPGHRGDPERAAEGAELRDALTRALLDLPDDLRVVFLLSEVSNLSYAEISHIVGCPEGTVGSRKHHAVERLRDHLRRHGHGL